MSVPTEARSWVLTNKPVGNPTVTGDSPTFTVKTAKLAPLADNQLLVKTLFLSNDPAQRTWIDANVPADRLYTQPIAVGQVMGARGIAEVIESTSSKASKGDHVLVGSIGWREYAVVGEEEVSLMKGVASGSQ